MSDRLVNTSRPIWRAGLSALTIVLVGCSGGGGHGGTSPSHVGTYLGTANTTLTGPTGTVPVNGSIQFVVAPDNTVSVSDPGRPPFGSGTLSGDTFVTSAPGSTLNSPGVSCTGSVAFDGTIAGVTMSGTVSSGGLKCNGVPFTVAGTFTATLQAEVPRRPAVGGVMEMMRNAIRPQ
jgi:hypothetical protein